MPLSIGKLELRLAGLSPQEGERLAEAVANQLATARSLAATGEVGSLRIRLPRRPDQSVDELTRDIVAEIVTAIEAAR